MIFSIPGGVVAILLQDFCEGSTALGHHRVITGIAGAQFHDHAGGSGVMIAARQQRRAGGRAESSGVKRVVAKTILRQTIHRWCWNRSTESGSGAEAYVIGQG